MASTGYSGTPLARKLGMVSGSVVLVRNEPPNYRDWLAPVPDGVVFAAKLSAATTLVHLFTDSQTELAAQLHQLRKSLRSDGALWVSWPKKASKVPTDITEDTIRTACLPLGFVDVKVCAVSEVWSGLKLVVRKELR